MTATIQELAEDSAGHLEKRFDNTSSGRGIWKWRHYFDIYERHLSKFRGESVRVVEIGVYSGGSLTMWRDYFGEGAQIIGVDIEPNCKRYEEPGVSIAIGDQGDRSFWQLFRSNYGTIDVLIDDGGHTSDQQIVTMEEMLPYMAPGGVFICEDIMGINSGFSSAVYGLASHLNQFDKVKTDLVNPDRRSTLSANLIQASIKSITLYPLVAVIELNNGCVSEFTAPKRGSLWEPHLS